MALNSDFKKAVDEARMQEVYQRLADILPIDPSLCKQDEMLRYAAEKLPKLYQPHDGEQLRVSPADWTEKYYDDMGYRLSKNFSRERLDLFRKMTKHRYADTIKYRDEKERERERTRAQPQTRPIEPKYIGGAAAVVGVVVTGVGIAVGSMATMVAGVVVAVGGMSVVVANSSKN